MFDSFKLFLSELVFTLLQIWHQKSRIDLIASKLDGVVRVSSLKLKTTLIIRNANYKSVFIVLFFFKI